MPRGQLDPFRQRALLEAGSVMSVMSAMSDSQLGNWVSGAYIYRSRFALIACRRTFLSCRLPLAASTN